MTSRLIFAFPDGTSGPGDWNPMTGKIEPSRDHVQPSRDHIIRVRVEEELRAERALGQWYEDHPTIHWDDLQAEHRARLALLERLAK